MLELEELVKCSSLKRITLNVVANTELKPEGVLERAEWIKDEFAKRGNGQVKVEVTIRSSTM